MRKSNANAFRRSAENAKTGIGGTPFASGANSHGRTYRRGGVPKEKRCSL